MTGLRYAPAEVKAFLATQPVSTYFRGATPDDLAALLFKPQASLPPSSRGVTATATSSSSLRQAFRRVAVESPPPPPRLALDRCTSVEQLLLRRVGRGA